MTEKAQKGLNNLFYTIVGGLLVAVISIALQSSKVDRTEFKTELDKKADKDVVEKMSNQIQFLYENEMKKMNHENQ